MASQVITSGAKVIIRDEKSAYDGMMGKVLVSQGKGKWLVRMALDNYQFVVSGNNLEIANETVHEEVKAEANKVQCPECFGDGERWDLTCNMCNGDGYVIETPDAAQDETAQLRAEIEALKAENSDLETENEKRRLHIAQIEAERDWLVANLYSNELAKYQAKFGANAHQPWQYTEVAASLAQAASEVTLVDAEIAELDEREKNGVFFWYFGAEPGYPLSTKLVSVPDTDEDWQVSNGYKLAPEYNTPANRAAIEARRKALGLEV